MIKEKERLNFEEVNKLCKKISNNIIKNGFRPDIIIAISRGGLIPARILADIFNIKLIGTIGIESYYGFNKGKLRVTQELGMNVKNKKILLVDDITDSGESLKFCLDYIKTKGAKEVKTATLHFKKGSIIVPDFYGKITNKWIVYPWEINETERIMQNEEMLKSKKNL